jgi:hypothetical protein
MMTDRQHGDRKTLEEVYVSVDIETAGPVPGEYSMLSLGACLVENPTEQFYSFNASFDWSFVNWYFHVFLGENPFGIGTLDIKSYYMGLSGCLWQETTSSQLPPNLQPSHRQSHNALDDAIAQAEIFKKLLQMPYRILCINIVFFSMGERLNFQ